MNIACAAEDKKTSSRRGRGKNLTMAQNRKKKKKNKKRKEAKGGEIEGEHEEN